MGENVKSVVVDNTTPTSVISAVNQVADAQDNIDEVEENKAPTLIVSNPTFNEDSPSNSIIPTATDPDGDRLTYELTSNPTNGTATINSATGKINYTPNDNFAGTDTLTVSVSDGNGGTAEKTVTLNIEAVNDLPTLIVSNPTFNEDSSSNSIIPTATDVDGDTLSYFIDRTPTHGVATINSVTGEIIYTPNGDFAGTDILTIVVSDGNGGTVEKTVMITVANIPENPTGEISSLTDDIAQITGDLLPQDNLGSVEYGFIVPTGETTSANAIDTYISGTITPDAVIENYISSGATASYSGGISALVDGSASSGTIGINVNFGTQSVTGDINIPQGNWNGAINSGSVSSYGFSSSDITGSSDYGSITSGTMDGKFYGVDASNVGGTIKLDTATKTASGVFGASGAITNQ